MSRPAYPEIAAVTAIALGGLVLSGWAFEVRSLTHLLSGAASMKPNTAVGILLLGIALWTVAATPGGQAARRIGFVSATVAALVGFLTLAQYVFSMDFGIDRLLFREPAATFAGSSPTCPMSCARR